MALLNSKRLYDRNIAFFVTILHRGFSNDLRQVREAMAKVRGPTGDAIANGWTSLFPCFGIGFNRQTSLHRDTRGLRGGVDVINVLGRFKKGDLRLQDLNVIAEWGPRCLGAFDGYDLAHEVLDWDGTHRVTLISFCRGTTWKGLKVPREVSRPTLAMLTEDLQGAHKLRRQYVQASASKRMAAEAGSTTG